MSDSIPYHLQILHSWLNSYGGRKDDKDQTNENNDSNASRFWSGNPYWFFQLIEKGNMNIDFIC